MHLGIQTDEEIKSGTLKWLCSHDKIIYAPDISNFPGHWKKPVSIKGEYPKSSEFGDSGICILFVRN